MFNGIAGSSIGTAASSSDLDETATMTGLASSSAFSKRCCNSLLLRCTVNISSGGDLRGRRRFGRRRHHKNASPDMTMNMRADKPIEIPMPMADDG